jgi:hypothetical protein
MFLDKKVKNTHKPAGGGGGEFFRKNINSAFSLIELSIVIKIMGLRVAGVPGGASMIGNTKITSLKREVDDLIRDVFTFYSRAGRLPGDIDNSGQIGWSSNRNKYPAGSFSSPYSMSNINVVSGPFIELYLYGISSFKPDPTKNGITTNHTNDGAVIRNSIAPNGGIPTSKIYKGFAFTHLTENASTTNINHIVFGIELGTKAINMFMSLDKKTITIVKKIELKFDDSSHSGGNIRGFCDGSLTKAYSSAINYCSELYFFMEIK